MKERKTGVKWLENSWKTKQRKGMKRPENNIGKGIIYL